MKLRANGAVDKKSAFTIVELLIVIVIIAILAAIVYLVYRGLSDRAETTIIESDLSQAAKQLHLDKALAGNFPGVVNGDGSGTANGGSGLSASDGVVYEYTTDGASFCLSATKGDKAYHITNDGSSSEGVCTGHAAPSGSGGGVIADGSFMQDITSANCPSDRTRAVDARDSHTYWVQKLADDRCWMLTNLAYAGGGDNTHGDVKVIADGTGGTGTYTEPRYYVQTSATHYTTEPTSPSTATNGSGQYGYHYNWCAAMGNQQSTAACMNGTVAYDTLVSICPAGWRLPSANYYGGEFTDLNTAINGGSSTSDTGLLSTWLGQYNGSWIGGTSFSSAGTYGYYWSSGNAGSPTSVYGLRHRAGQVVTTGVVHDKRLGYSVRCTTM